MNKKYIFSFVLVIALLLTACSSDSNSKSKDQTTETSSEATTQSTTESSERPATEKPVIYLYPPKATDITVKLDYNGKLITTYPEYNGQWQVTAYPDGTIINKADQKAYSYLFWDGIAEIDCDFSKGFVVKGEDTAQFLQEKLSEMGLLPREYNEFIVYWLPQMQNNVYNLIAFQGDKYTDNAKLMITPQPDSLLRVFMAYKPLDKPIEIETQTVKPFVRNGFTVVEWGGCLVK